MTQATVTSNYNRLLTELPATLVASGVGEAWSALHCDRSRGL